MLDIITHYVLFDARSRSCVQPRNSACFCRKTGTGFDVDVYRKSTDDRVVVKSAANELAASIGDWRSWTRGGDGGILVKLVESLTVEDLAANAVWAFANSDGHGETMVRPVKAIPVTNTAAKIFGTLVSLANGTGAWALHGNVVALSPRETLHLLTVSVERDGRWFHLARYHDFDSADRGPAALARFLGFNYGMSFRFPTISVH
jgi:hypothetical protein